MNLNLRHAPLDSDYDPSEDSHKLIGYYNERGYRIMDITNNEDIYEAGNSPYDSAQYVSPEDGVRLDRMKEECEQTLGELCEERDAFYVGVEYEEDLLQVDEDVLEVTDLDLEAIASKIVEGYTSGRIDSDNKRISFDFTSEQSRDLDDIDLEEIARQITQGFTGGFLDNGEDQEINWNLTTNIF